MATAMLGIALFVQPVAEAGAAMYAVPPFTGSEARLVQRESGADRARGGETGTETGAGARDRMLILVGAAAPDGAERRPGVGRWAGLADPIGTAAHGWHVPTMAPSLPVSRSARSSLSPQWDWCRHGPLPTSAGIGPIPTASVVIGTIAVKSFWHQRIGF